MSCRGENEKGLYNGRARFSASFEAKWKQARTAGFWMFYSSLWLRSDWRKILDVLGEKKNFPSPKELTPYLYGTFVKVASKGVILSSRVVY